MAGGAERRRASIAVPSLSRPTTLAIVTAWYGLSGRSVDSVRCQRWRTACTFVGRAAAHRAGAERQLNEAIGTRDLPIVVFPRVNAAHARHPSWDEHLQKLRRAGVHLVYGDDVWPLHEPRSAPGRELPWSAVLDAVNAVVPASH